ncbi:hypothetical protein ACS0TY_008403 [Phlomoides rotata]
MTNETYNFLLNQRGITTITEERSKGFKLIWKNFAPSKVIAHAWRLLWDRLPTKSNLCRRGVLGRNSDLNCCLCRQETETGKHLFFEFGWRYTVMTRPNSLHQNPG